MSPQTIEKAIDFFYPYLDKKTDVILFGGEPLLAYKNVKHTVSLLEAKNGGSTKEDEQKEFTYYLTTNGMLINDVMLDYFQRYSFGLMLSFDGLTQDTARQAGSHKKLHRLIRHIRENYPDIDFSLNSVFTPETVSYISDSYRYIIESGVREALFSLSSIQPWDEPALQELEVQLDKLTGYLLEYYRENREIPVTYFQEPKESPDSQQGGFVCAAGRDRISVTPDEEVWGCYLFHDYLKNKQKDNDYSAYSFGKLDEFIENHETLFPRILENYLDLRQSRFLTDAEEEFCFLCEEVGHCSVCPVNAAYSTGFIGRIPAWLCRLNKIQMRAKERFLEKKALLSKK
jgi:sulfatase maturation enzyme AslB (radical SAM superfamily)